MIPPPQQHRGAAPRPTPSRAICWCAHSVEGSLYGDDDILLPSLRRRSLRRRRYWALSSGSMRSLGAFLAL